MKKLIWKPGNMLYPLPAVMITCGELNQQMNIITISWAGTICTNPPMVSISVRPERYSYDLIKKNGEFVINLTTEKQLKAADYCGVTSGRDHDKFKKTGLTPGSASLVKAPIIEECPVNIECRVKEILPLGSHDLFIADVAAVLVDEAYLDENNRFHLNKTKPICYSHGRYYGLSEELGSFGYSVRKKKT